MLRRAAFITALVLLLVAAVLFVALNRQSFDVDLAVVRFGVSSGLALLIAFAAGLLAGALWSSASIARLLGRAWSPAQRVAPRRGASGIAATVAAA